MERINNGNKDLPIKQPEESQPKPKKSGISLKAAMAWSTLATALSIGGVILPLHFAAHVFSGKTIAALAGIQWGVVLCALLQSKSKVVRSAPEKLEYVPIDLTKNLYKGLLVSWENFQDNTNRNIRTHLKTGKKRFVVLENDIDRTNVFILDGTPYIKKDIYDEIKSEIPKEIKEKIEKQPQENDCHDKIATEIETISNSICANIEDQAQRNDIKEKLFNVAGSNFNQKLSIIQKTALLDILKLENPNALPVTLNDISYYKLRKENGKIILEVDNIFVIKNVDKQPKYKTSFKLEIWPEKNEKGEYKIQTSGTFGYKKIN